MLFGAVVVAQVGTQMGMRLKSKQLRILLALMVLGICEKLGPDLNLLPAEFYSLGPVRGY